MEGTPSESAKDQSVDDFYSKLSQLKEFLITNNLTSKSGSLNPEEGDEAIELPFTYSCQSKDPVSEFKNAKWIVVTSPSPCQSET